MILWVPCGKSLAKARLELHFYYLLSIYFARLKSKRIRKILKEWL